MCKVLIVEDEANIRRFVATNLSVRGLTVAEAGDAEEGLRLMRQSKPEVLILDIRLPGMSVWDLLNEMKADASLSSIPVIVMTASVTNVRFGESGYANVVRWLVKPVSVVELLQAVKSACNRTEH